MDLYAEIILDHYKNPRNAKILEHADLKGSDHNPLCGDKVEISIKIDQNDRVVAVGYNAEGCAISTAAISLLSEDIQDKTLREIEALDKDDIYALLGVEISPGRSKCALLGLACIKKLIKQYYAT